MSLRSSTGSSKARLGGQAARRNRNGASPIAARPARRTRAPRRLASRVRVRAGEPCLQGRRSGSRRRQMASGVSASAATVDRVAAAEAFSRAAKPPAPPSSRPSAIHSDFGVRDWRRGSAATAASAGARGQAHRVPAPARASFASNAARVERLNVLAARRDRRPARPGGPRASRPSVASRAAAMRRSQSARKPSRRRRR